MRLHWLQHVPFEGLEFIQGWAHERGFICTKTEFHSADWSLPDVEDIDWLIVMGGPMGVGDSGSYPWLKDEKLFLRESIERGKTVMGVCLGAQLIADVMGAEVRRNADVEIGWHEVRLTEAGQKANMMCGLPSEFQAFHWHGDTFDIPPSACHLAESDACVNQAFSFEDRVVALQFHLESSPDSVEMLIQHCSADLRAGTYVQEVDQIRSLSGMCKGLNGMSRVILDNLLMRDSI